MLTDRSSSSTRTITDLTTSLTSIIARFEATVGPTLVPSSRPATPASRPPASLTPQQDRGTPTTSVHNDGLHSSASSTLTSASSLTTHRRRPAPSLSEYLSKREKEDARGGETGLLSLGNQKAGPAQSGQTKSQRDQLLAGQRSEGVMGNSQLHEELGGQLAEVRSIVHLCPRSQPDAHLDVPSAQAECDTFFELARG
jgi:hypothetical protein